MINIGKPIIEYADGKAVMKAFVKDEVQGLSDWLYFLTGEDFGKYLTDEVGDAFLVAMLLPAIKTRQKIAIDAPISEKLYHNISNTVVPMLNHVYGAKEKQDGEIVMGGVIYAVPDLTLRGSGLDVHSA